MSDLDGCTGELKLTYKENLSDYQYISLTANGQAVTITADGHDKTTTITVDESTTQLVLVFTNTSDNQKVVLDNFKLVGTREAKTPTSLSFNGLSDTKVILTEGLLDNKKFMGKTCAETNGVPGTITYSASGDGVATVDATSGTVTVNANVYGKTVITANFTPADRDFYELSQASYTIINTYFSGYDDVADLRADINGGSLTVDNNHYINVAFKDVKVIYMNQSTYRGVTTIQYFIREGEGDKATAICLHNPGITLNSNSILNGSFTGVLYNYNGMLCLTQCDGTSADDITETTSTDEAEPLEISTDDVASHVCDLVTVKGATSTKSGSNTLVKNGASDTAPTYYNEFCSGVTSVFPPYAGANVDLTSAIVTTTKSNETTVYRLCPTAGGP